MNTDQILQASVRLFSRWGLSSRDYSFAGERALQYLGFPIRPVRKNHFDFFVVAKKLPWKSLPNTDATLPPKDSAALRDLQAFMRRTQCDPHFLPVPLINITPENITQKSLVHRLATGERIRIIKPFDMVINYYRATRHWDLSEAFAEEKILRWLRGFARYRRAAARKSRFDIVRWCDRGIRFVEESRRLIRATAVSGDRQQLQGQTGHPGRVRGTVRVVASDHDLRRVKPGEIIVSMYAKPAFAQILNKMAGLVTDHGGTISHAAILARENNIPCIIGTKAATKVFKTGDRVEVDATKGIVKKI